MATAGALIELLSQKFGMPSHSISYIYRVLRDAGIIAKGGRGRSAPNVKSRDAANLIIAAVSSVRSRDTYEAWGVYSSLHYQKMNSKSLDSDWSQMSSSLSIMNDRHTFVDSLEAIIEATASGDLDYFWSPINPGIIEIEMSGPVPFVYINAIFGKNYRLGKIYVREGAFDHIDYDTGELIYDVRSGLSDLNISQTFSGDTIFSIGRLLSS